MSCERWPLPSLIQRERTSHPPATTRTRPSATPRRTKARDSQSPHAVANRLSRIRAPDTNDPTRHFRQPGTFSLDICRDRVPFGFLFQVCLIPWEQRGSSSTIAGRVLSLSDLLDPRQPKRRRLDKLASLWPLPSQPLCIPDWDTDRRPLGLHSFEFLLEGNLGEFPWFVQFPVRD